MDDDEQIAVLIQRCLEPIEVDTGQLIAGARQRGTRLRRRRRRRWQLALAGSVAGVWAVSAAGVAAWWLASGGGSADQLAGTRPSPHPVVRQQLPTDPSRLLTGRGDLTDLGAEPAWVRQCLRPATPVVTAYLGLTLTQAQALAAQRGEHVSGITEADACRAQANSLQVLARSTTPERIVVIALSGSGSDPDQTQVVWAAPLDLPAGN